MPEGKVHPVEQAGQSAGELPDLVEGPLRDETIVVFSGGSLAGNADLRKDRERGMRDSW